MYNLANSENIEKVWTIWKMAIFVKVDYIEMEQALVIID